MRGAVWLLTLAAYAAAPSDGGRAPMDEGPYLAWTFVAQPRPGGGPPDWHQEAVTWTSADGRPLWRRALPERVRAAHTGLGDEEVAALRQYPRGLHNASFLIGLLVLEDALLLADDTGLLALAKADGAARLDHPFAAARKEEDRVWFDRGTYRIRYRGQDCTGEARGGRFLADCGERLYAFSGSELVVLSRKSLRVLGTVAYQRRLHDRPRKAAQRAAELQALEATVVIEGIIYLE